MACFYTYKGIHGKSLGIQINDAAYYINTGPEINVVLNTPFCLINTSAKPSLREFKFFSKGDLDKIRSSVIIPDEKLVPNKKNIVLISIESGGTVWSDKLNIYRHKIRKSYMPFLDSLIDQSLSVKHVFATNIVSLDGLQNIYAGIPSAEGFTFVVSEYVNNRMSAPILLLANEGYDTKFYYGGYEGAYTIDKLAATLGFKFVTHKKIFPDQSAHDGAWGIFDHALGIWMAQDISNLKEPFLAAWHTLNPHEPFKCPTDWNTENYKSDPGTPERGAEYLDRSLQAFFNIAEQQPWYDNTIFIITADHGTRDLKGSPLATPYIQSHIFFIVFDPSGSLPTGIIEDKIMNQCDIGPTLLTLVGYNKPYVAIGKNIFSEDGGKYAINFLYENCRIISSRYLVMMDMDLQKIECVYDITTDLTLEEPLESYDIEEVNNMLRWGRALMQDYTERMKEDRMYVDL